MKIKAWKLSAAFVGGAVLYGIMFVGCVGTEPGSTGSTACGTIGPLLKTPFLHVLPYAQSRYFGIDALVLFLALNVLFWGFLAVGVTWFVSRRRDREPASSN